MRICNREGIFVTIAKKGNEEAGAVLLKLNRGQAGCEVFSQIRSVDGDPGWLRATGKDLVSEAEADSYIAQEMGFDPDLWVVEIEDQKGLYQMDGEILS